MLILRYDGYFFCSMPTLSIGRSWHAIAYPFLCIYGPWFDSPSHSWIFYVLIIYSCFVTALPICNLIQAHLHIEHSTYTDEIIIFMYEKKITYIEKSVDISIYKFFWIFFFMYIEILYEYFKPGKNIYKYKKNNQKKLLWNFFSYIKKSFLV